MKIVTAKRKRNKQRKRRVGRGYIAVQHIPVKMQGEPVNTLKHAAPHTV